MLGELRARAVEAALHRADRDVAYLRRLFIGKLGDADHQQNLAVLGRQLVQRFLHVLHGDVRLLTAFDGDEDIFRAMEAGVQGYVLKNSTGEHLIPALRAVAAGSRWMPPEVEQRLATRKTYEPLTPRELEVLHELAKGLANKQIASVLNISEHTAKGYLKNILYKLHVADRTESVTVAIQRGLIQI